MTGNSCRTISYGTTYNEYELSFSPRKTLAIHVHPYGSVSVDAPLDSSLEAIDQRIHKRAAWNVRQQRDYQCYSVDFPLANTSVVKRTAF